MVRKDALAHVRLQDGEARLLDLEEEGVALAGHEEHHPAGSSDAADAHHLDGRVPELVAVEQGLVGGRERGAVPGEHVPHGLLDLTRRVILVVEDGGELVPDEGHLPLVLGELREDLLALALPPLLLQALDGPLVNRGVLDGSQQVTYLQRLVPKLQSLEPAVSGHGLAVGADAGRGHVLGSGVLQAVVPASHDEARGESLDVPLPRGREGLVEVVDREDDPPLRRGESAEVGEMSVSAALDVDSRGRRGSQVGRHREGRPAVEGERGAGHAPVTEGEQLRHPPLLRREDHLDRVLPAGGGLPGGVRLPGAGLSQLLARGVALRRGQVPAEVGAILRSDHRGTPPFGFSPSVGCPGTRR